MGTPRFLSARWQQRLQRERPAAFAALCLFLTLPVIFLLRLALNGEFGGAVQMALKLVGLCLIVGLGVFLIAQRLRRKQREALIDRYLEERHNQMHPPEPSD